MVTTELQIVKNQLLELETKYSDTTKALQVADSAQQELSSKAATFEKQFLQAQERLDEQTMEQKIASRRILQHNKELKTLLAKEHDKASKQENLLEEYQTKLKSSEAQAEESQSKIQELNKQIEVLNSKKDLSSNESPHQNDGSSRSPVQRNRNLQKRQLDQDTKTQVMEALAKRLELLLNENVNLTEKKRFLEENVQLLTKEVNELRKRDASMSRNSSKISHLAKTGSLTSKIDRFVDSDAKNTSTLHFGEAQGRHELRDLDNEEIEL